MGDTIWLMANKRKKETDVPITAEPTDQHRARKMFRIEDDIHRGYKILARRNDRPMSREFRAALIEHLRKNGLWPVPQDEE